MKKKRAHSVTEWTMMAVAVIIIALFVWSKFGGVSINLANLSKIGVSPVTGQSGGKGKVVKTPTGPVNTTGSIGDTLACLNGYTSCERKASDLGLGTILPNNLFEGNPAYVATVKNGTVTIRANEQSQYYEYFNPSQNALYRLTYTLETYLDMYENTQIKWPAQVSLIVSQYNDNQSTSSVTPEEQKIKTVDVNGTSVKLLNEVSAGTVSLSDDNAVRDDYAMSFQVASDGSISPDVVNLQINLDII